MESMFIVDSFLILLPPFDALSFIYFSLHFNEERRGPCTLFFSSSNVVLENTQKICGSLCDGNVLLAYLRDVQIWAPAGRDGSF